MRAFEKLNRISEQFRAIRPLSLAKSVFAACLIAGTISAAGLRLSAEGTKDIGETAFTNYEELFGIDLSNEKIPDNNNGQTDLKGRYYYTSPSATSYTDRLASVARWNFRGYTNNETSLFMGVKNQQRFKFYAYAGETVYLASSGKIDAGTNSDGACEAVVEYPDGTKHYVDFTESVGHISTREQEKKGPNGVYLPILTDDRKRVAGSGINTFEGYKYEENPVTGGYTPYELKIEQSGVYIVDFRTNYPTNSTTASTKMSADTFDINGHNITAIDITVAKKGPGDKMYAQSGRVWADAFSTQVSVPMYGYLYTVTRDGYIWRFALNGMNPWTFSMYANARGPIGMTTNASVYHSFHSPMRNHTDFDIYADMLDKNGNADGVLIVSPDNEVSDLDSPYHMFLNYPAPDLPESVAKLTASDMGEVTALRYDGRTGSVDSDEKIDDEENIYGLVGVGGFFETVTTPGTSSYRVVIDMSNMYAVHYHGEVISPGIHYGESGRDSHEEEICLSVPYGTNGAHCDINFVFWDESKSQWYGIFSKVQIGKDGAYDQHPISAPGQDISELVEIRELYSNELNFSGLKNDNPPTLGEDFTVKNGSGEDVVYKCCGKIMLGNAAVDDQVDKLLWNGRDEYGRILPVGYYFGTYNDVTYPGKVYAEPKAGEVHYPLGDVETLTNGVAIWLENPPSYIEEEVGYLGRDEVTVRSSLFYNNEDKSILRDFTLPEGYMPARLFLGYSKINSKGVYEWQYSEYVHNYNKNNTTRGNNAWFWNLPSNVGSFTAGEVVNKDGSNPGINRTWVKNGGTEVSPVAPIFANKSLDGEPSYKLEGGKLVLTNKAASFVSQNNTDPLYGVGAAAENKTTDRFWTGLNDPGSDHGVVDIWTHVIGEKYELKNPIELRHEADKVMVTGFVYLEDQANTAGYGKYDTGTNDVALPGAEVTGIYYTYEPGYDYKTDTSSDKVKLPSVISASEIPEGLRPHVYNTVTNTNGIYSIPVDMAEFKTFESIKDEDNLLYTDYYEKIFLVVSYTDPSAEKDPITGLYPITHVVTTDLNTGHNTEDYKVHHNVCYQKMSLAAAEKDANKNPMVKKEYVADYVGYKLESNVSNLRIQKVWDPEDYANSSLSAVFKVVGLYKDTNNLTGDTYNNHYEVFKKALEEGTYNYLLEGVTVDVARGGSVVLKNLPKSVYTVPPGGGDDTTNELVYAVIEEEMGGELTIEHNSAEKIDGVTYDNWVFTNKIDPSTFTETVWFDYNGDKTNNAGNNSADKNKDYLMSEATVRIQMEKDGRWADDFEYIVDETSKDAETITSDTVFTLKNGQKFCDKDGVLTINGLLPGRYKVIIEFPTGSNYNSAVVFGHEGNDAVVLPTAESDQPEKLNQVVQIVTIPSHGDVKAEVGVGALEGSVDLSEYIDINKTLKHSDGKTDSVNINPEFEFDLALKDFKPASTATPENYGDNAADVEGSASIEFDSDKKFGAAYAVAADDFKTKINFKAAGTYVFTLTEKPTTASGVKSDENSYELTFEVSNDNNAPKNDGTELNVKLTKIEKVVSGKANESVTLNSSGKTALNFENVYTPGKVTVTVEANGDGKPDDPVFSYTVQIFDADKHAIKGEFPCVKNGTESKIGHNGTFTLKHGESITISELPDGAEVRVYETEKNGFTVSHTVNGGAETSVDSVSVDVASGSDGEKKIKFINKFETGGLIIAKEVVGTTDKPEFTFNLTLNGSTSSQKIPAFKGNIEVVDSTGKVLALELSAAAPTDKITKTITIPAGGKATISYIPKGVKVEVTEAAAAGYTLTHVDGGSDGKYTRTVEAAAESDYPTATFYNSVPTTAEFSGTKKITGRDWVSAIDDGKYTFTLTAVYGAPMPSSGTTATASNVGQNINFGDITFTKVGTYYYKITETEVDTSVKGVTKSSDVWYVRATVTEDTSHQLQVKTEYSLKDFNDRVEANRPAADDIKTTFEFTNTYKAAGSDPVSVEVTKNLTGPVEKLSKNFTFTVKEVDKDGKDVAGYTHDPVTITVTGSGENYTGTGTVTLKNSYTEAGTHYYIITENRGTIPKMNYDSSEYRITVVVTDNNETAKLDTRVTIEKKAGTAWTDPIVFNNAYSVSPVTSAQLTITKNYRTVGGTALAIADGKFSFTANITGDNAAHAKFANNTAGNTVSTPAGTGSVTMPLGAITFDCAGTYTLTVAETTVADANVATDPAKTITFEVEDQSGALAITGMTDGEGEEIKDLAAYLTFNNVFTPEPVSTDSPGGTLGDISPKFAKVFKDTDSGKIVEVSSIAAKDYKNAFSFTIASADGSPLPAVETVNNDGRDVEFGAIKFMQEGTYTYKVTENAYADSKITIDSAEITVTYVVSCDDNGELSISAPTYSKSSKVGAEDDSTFVNQYNPVDVSLQIAKNVTGAAVHADKEFEFSVTINNEDNQPKTFTLNGKTVTGSGKFKLKNGESVTITGLHYKDSYTVTETVPAGYSNANSERTGEFTREGETVELTFNNEYSLTSVSATLPSVKKTLTGRKMEDKEFNFQISVSPTDGAELPKTTTMPVEMAKEATNTGSVSFGNITFTKAGTYNVTFSEVTSAAAPGITYAEPQTVTYNVIDDGEGNLVISSVEGIESGNVLNFTNAYTRPVISVEKTQSVNDSAATTGTVAVKEGDKVTFTMTVTNSADGSKATNVVLEDKVPSGLVIDSASLKLNGTPVTPGSDTIVGNTVKVDIGELAGGEKAIVSFDVTVPHVNRTRSWTNTAKVEYDSPLKEDGSPYGDNVTGDTTSEVESKPVTLTASVGTVSVTNTTVGTSSYEKEHDKFTFKIKIEGVNPDSYFWVTDGVSTSNYAKATLDEDGYLIIEKGVGTNIQLTDSHTIKIWSIPAGAKVTVTETPLAGYTCDNPEQTVEPVSTDHVLKFTNTRNLKTLTVGKQLLETDYGADNIKDYDEDKVFTFKIKLSGITLTVAERRLTVTANDKKETPGEIFARNDNITDGKITFNRDYTATVMLKDGESVTISGIPEGAGYEITEDPTAGYEADLDGSEKGTVGAADVNVTINNKKLKPAAISVEIPVVKNLVDGKGHKVFSLEGKSFTFRLTAKSGNPASDPFAGGAQVTVDNDSELEKKFTADFTDAGTYSYTLEEINGGIPNVNYSVEKYDVEVKVSEETKDGIFTGKYTYEVSFRKNGDSSWTKVSDIKKPTFTNVYDKHDLTVGKTVAGRDGERDREWHYNVVFYLPTSAHAQFDFNNLAAAYPSVKEEGAEVTPGEVTWNQWYVDCNTYPSADPNNTEVKTSQTNLIYCSFTLKHGQTMTIRNLPEGTIYKVLETDMPVHSDPGSLEPSGGGQPGEYEVRIHTDDPGALTIEGEEYEGGTDLGDGEHITRTIAGTLVAVYKGKDFGDANIAYTNECPKPIEGQGRLNVYKDATGSADLNKEWKFRITMTSEPPMDDSGENPLLTYSYRINGGGKLGSVTTTHDKDKETLDFEEGSDGNYYAEITLKNGGLFTLYGLPSKGDNAAQFEITEEDSENITNNGYNISYETVERTIDTGSGSTVNRSEFTGATAEVGFKGDDVNAIYVAFTNDRPERTLSVTKEVSGTAGDTTEFDFTLEVYYSDGVESAITDAGNTKDGYKISINGSTASDLEFTTEGGRSIAKFKLKNGDTAVITGLPNGAKYKVTENHGADYLNTEIKVDDVPVTLGEAEGQLDHDPKVVFTNERNTAELKVKKVIKNADGKEVSASQQDEIFTVNLSFTAPDNVKLAGNYSYTVNGGAEQTLKLTKSGTSSTYTATLQLSHNETATISGLPVGTICSASEKLTNSDYTSEVSDSVTLEAASAKEITVTNTYHRPALKVTKSVTVGGVTTSDTSSGAIEAKDQNTITYTITVENVGDEGSTARNITVTDVLPGGLSAVRGSSKADNGTATRSIVGGVTTVTWHLDKDLNKGESATLSFDVYIPYVEENTEWTNTATASYDNEPEVPSETEQLTSNEIKVKKTVGSLTITKTVVDNDSAGEFSFNLQLTGDKIYNSYTVNGETVLFDNNTSVDGVYHEFTLRNGESLVVMGLDPDTTFILTENLKPQSGYTVKMNDLETQNITDTVENVSTVNVVNTYHPPVLTVTKTQSVNGVESANVNVKPGDKIDYTITIENNGDEYSVVTGARLTDAIAINADLATELTRDDITVTRNGEKIIPTVSISGDNVLSVGPFKDIGSTDKIEISYSVTVPRVTVSSKTWSNTASVRYSNSLSSTPVSSNTVTATERLNSLTVKKSVVRAGGSEIEDSGTYNFDITLTAFNGEDITAELAGDTTFSLANNGSKTIAGIPEGTTYKIVETHVEDYTTKYKIGGEDVTVEAAGEVYAEGAFAGENIEITAENTYYRPDITVTKTQSVNGAAATEDDVNVQPGDEITYTVTVTSNGDDDSVARGIEISDKIPDGLKLDGVITATPGTTAAESEGTITWTVGDLAVGETATMSYTVVVPVQTEDAKWTNTAVATFANNRDNTTAKEEIPSNTVTATEKTWSLTVNKSVIGVDGDAIADDDGTYEFAVTLTASNDADITAELAGDTTFSLKNGDEKVIPGIPEGTTYKIVETPVEDYTTKYKIGGEDVTVEAAGEVYAEGAFAGEDIEITAENTHHLPKVTLTKLQKLGEQDFTADDLNVRSGDKVTYKLMVKNEGDEGSTARDITVTDVIPEGLTVGDVTGAEYDAASRTLAWKISELDVNKTEELEYTVTVPYETASKSWTNTASAKFKNDPKTTKKTASVKITESVGSLKVSKSVVEDPLYDGEAFTVNISLTDGAEPFDGTFKVGSGYEDTEDDSVDSGKITFTGGKATVKLADKESITILGIPVGIGYEVEETLDSDDYTVKYSESESGIISDGAVEVKVVNTYIFPEISIVKTGEVLPDGIVSTDGGVTVVKPGAEVSYTIKVTNNGENAAENVVVTDKLEQDFAAEITSPSDISVDKKDGVSVTVKDGVITVTIESLEPGETVTAEFKVTIPEISGVTEKSWTNSATVVYDNDKTPDPSDPDPVPKTSETDPLTEKLSDLTVNLESVYADGSDFDDAEEFNLSLKFSTGREYEAEDGTKSGSFTLGDGGSVTFKNVPVGVDYTLTESGIGEDYTVKGAEIVLGSATAAEGSISESGSTANVTNVYHKPNITVTKTQSVNGVESANINVQPGNEITYTVTVTSNGDEDSVARGIEITDEIPDGLKLSGDITVTAGVATNSGTITWNVGDLEVGETATMTYTVIVPVETTATEWRNTAVATFENNRDNTTAKEEISSNTVTAAEKTWSLTVNKSVIGVDELPIADDDGTYEFAVTLTASSGEDITEKLTAKTFSLANGMSKEITGIPDGTTYTITETPVKDYTTAYIINDTESLAATGVVSENTNVTVVNTYYRPDITVTKTQSVNSADPTTDAVAVKPGDKITYTVTVTSNGDEGSVARGIEITDEIPDGLTISGDIAAPAGTTAAESGGTITWTVGDLEVGKTATMTYTVTVPVETTATEWSNTAVATFENNRDNTTAKEEIPSNTVTAAETTWSLTVNKSVIGVDGVPIEDDDGTYEFNIKLTASNGEDITEKLAGDKTFSLKNGENVVIEGIPDGTTYTITENPVADYTTAYIINGVESSTATGEISGDTSVTVVNTYYRPDITVTKTQSVNSAAATKDDVNVQPGNEITYTVTVTSNGDADSVARGIEITDKIPNGLTLSGDIVAPIGTTAAESGTITWNVGDLAVGKTATMSYTVTVPVETTATEWRNTAVATFENNRDNTTAKEEISSNTVSATEKTWSLTVEKSVIGVDGDAIADDDGTYEFNITLTASNGKDITGEFAKDTTFSLKNGDEKVIPGIPEGTTYKIVETPVEDYTTEYKIGGEDVTKTEEAGEVYAEGTFAGKDIEITAENTYYRPDITVTKTQSVNDSAPTTDAVAVKPGDKITYTVTVTSNGDAGSVARGVKLSDKLHPDFVGKVSASDVEVSAAGAKVEVSPEGVVTVDLGDMPAGSTADVTFSVNIPLKTDGASGWTNSATAVYDNNRDNPAGGYLEITSNEVVLTEKTADLEITLKVENVDGTEADTVVETAEGDKQVEFDFVLDLLMPDGTPTKDEFAYSVVQGDIAVAGEGTIKSGTKITLYNGGSIIIHNVPEGIIANVTEILDSGDNYTVKDSENKYEFGETLTLSGDGDAIEIVNVYHQPIFDIDKSQDVSDVKPGGTITYFLFVDNSSEDPDSHVRNVELSDILPVPDLTYRENSAGIVRGRISSTDELAAISPEDIIPGSVIIAPATVPETGEPTVELIWNGEDNKIDEFASLDFKEGYTVYFTVDISPDLIGERDWRNIATARFVNHKSRVQAMSESAEAIEVETENSDKVEVYLGSLAIEKEVSGIGVVPEDLEREYGFSVEFDSSNVLPEDVYDLSAYPYIITTGDGSVVESGEIPLAGGRFTLSHGERIEITSLPKGLEYKLTEDHTDGFDVYGELVTYDTKEPLGYSGSVFGGKVEDVSGSVILVRNDKLEKRKLTVSKTVSGMNADQTLEFSFGIILTDSFGNPLAGPFESVKHTALGDVPALVSSGQSFTLRHGESMEITGLATDTVYTVTEPDAEILGYSSNIGAVGSGTVGRNDITIEVNNVKLPEKGQLAVTVDVAGTSKFVPEIKQNSFFGISVSLDGAAAGQQFFYRIFEPGEVAVTAAEPLYTVPGGFTESGIIPSADLFAEASPEGEAQTVPEPDVSENLGEAEGEEQNAPALETLDPNLIPFTGQIALKYGQTAVIYGLPDGTTYNVTQISADIGVHYTTEYDGCSGIIAGSAGSVAKILNTVNAEGNLTVKNDTVGADVPFEITVTLTDSTISGVYGEMEFIDGVARFSLTSGQSLTAAGLPEGTQYTVDIAENPDYTTEMSGDLGPIVETVTNVVSFKNTERGALTLEKTAKGFALAGTEYSFTITLTDKNGELLSEELGYTGPDGDGTFTGKLEIKLQAGETVKINRIPDGTHYLIEEDVYEGYIVEKFNEEGVIVYGQTTAAGFVNIKTAPTYPPGPPTPVTPVTPDEPDTPDNPDNPDEPGNPDDSEGLPEITIPTPIEPKFESAVEEKSFAAGLAAIAGGLAKLATR